MLSLTQRTQFTRLAQDIPDSPYMLVDPEILVGQCVLFKESFPTISPYYALKCFTNDKVVETIDEYLGGYDVASVKEIETLLQLGVSPDRLSYSNPVKAAAAIERAALLGVHRFAFQSENELEKLAVAAPGSDVYLRLDVTSAKGSLDFSSKFGAPCESAQELLAAAQAKGLKPLGITFHVGSQAEDTQAWARAIRTAGGIIREAGKAGITLTELNIGGGFPVEYKQGALKIQDLAKVVNAEVAEITGEFPDISVIAEPGRFLVADCGVIVSTVIGKETRGGKPWLYLDTGTFQSFMELFEFDEFFYPVYSLKHESQPTQNIEYALTGPTCDSYDTMTRSIQLPDGIEVGDKLLVSMTGAYTLSYGSNFNGFEMPRTIFINSDRATDTVAGDSAQRVEESAKL